MNRVYFNGLKTVAQIKEDTAWIIEVDTTLPGVSNSDQFQFTGAVGEYNVEAYQGGNLVSTFSNLVNEQTITLPTGGIYQLRVIPQGVGFDKVTFNDGGDKSKLLKTLQWGDYGINEPDQRNAFRGCNNHTEIADDGKWFDIVTVGILMFQNNNLSSIPSKMTLLNLANGVNMFRNNNLSSLPSGMTLSNLNSGISMFQNNNLSSLPSGMTLLDLTNGNNMFNGNNLSSLPSGMTLSNLTSGISMFNGNNLSSLPSGMELPNLTNGSSMFTGNNLSSLPSGMTLSNLTFGNNMFQNNNLSSLPSGMTLSNLTTSNSMFAGNNLSSLPSGMTLSNLNSGISMFLDNNLTSLPSGMELSNLTDGILMFSGNTINTARYSQLLIDLEANNPNNNVNFHGGDSKYNAAGQAARDILTAAPRNWIITDGGIE